MLSYRHAFHAGNHADVLKHFALCAVLEKLQAKNKSFSVFDTHAGAGLYNIESEMALKTGENISGIKKLCACDENILPQELLPYIRLCKAYAEHSLYPGSPEIERYFMCQDDALVLCELHNTEIEILKSNMHRKISDFKTTSAYKPTSENAVKAQIHHRNGYEALLALTPPKIRRGLAVIDPSYEEKSDYLDAAKTIAAVHKKWNNGIIMLWYPLLAHRKQEIAAMKRTITAAAQTGIICETLDVQLLINTEDSHVETSLEEASGSKTPRLYGSGLFFINPPYLLKEQFENVLPFLSEKLGTDGKGSFSIN